MQSEAWRLAPSLAGLLLGLILGSFLNVLILHLSGRGSIFRARSACPLCGRRLAWKDNLPLLSFLLLRGKCRWCGGAISPQYPLVEGLSGVFTALTLGWFGPGPWGFCYVAFLAGLLTAGAVDWRTGLVPDVVTLPLILLGLAAAALLPGPGWQWALWGALGTAGGLYLVARIFALLRGKEGLGLGDVKLGAVLGAFLGWQGAVWAVLLGAVSGLVFYGVRRLLGRMDWDSPVPFAPFLALGGGLSLFLGDWLMAL